MKILSTTKSRAYKSPLLLSLLGNPPVKFKVKRIRLPHGFSASDISVFIFASVHCFNLIVSMIHAIVDALVKLWVL